MSDLKDLFVPYKLALQLKKKGFSEACLGAYSDSKELYISKVSFQSNFEGYCLAPTYDQITDWFITNHKIQLKAVAMDFEGKVKWFYECQDIKLYKSLHFDQKVFRFKVMSPNISNTYRSALTKAITEAIKTI